MIKKLDKNNDRIARHLRVREKISGTTSVPRLNVYRSASNIYAQIVDDLNAHTLVSSNTLQKEIAELVSGKTNCEAAFITGKILAEKAIKNGIKKVVFDRSGYIYTGRVKNLAEGAREGGLEF
ncbi:MAG: 50S ribosomal protein L18 [Clostridia bacterium]|jgi:large subunit ribosomal protein L18|nr:50S ribosomal protein L18 [Clostridia bacterium]MDD4275565.1 50S ribosomal protein L18 [Clostridia bacterium]